MPSEAFKPEIKQITPEDMFKLDVSGYYPERKEDGMLAYAIAGDKGITLFSDRMVNISSKYPHIIKQLENIPKGTILVGEMHIQNGNVFDVNTKANYPKARYCIFDIIQYEGISTKDKPIEERKELLAKLIHPNTATTEHIEFPFSNGTYSDMWSLVEANKWEGIVLKPKNSFYAQGWLKCKLLQEIKIRILAYDPKEGKKGAFILDGGNRCDALSPAYVQQFMDIQARGKTAIAECEYAFLTKEGKLFQPRLRQIIEQ
jgi:ATP-dependent DNA ligase